MQLAFKNHVINLISIFNFNAFLPPSVWRPFCAPLRRQLIRLWNFYRKVFKPRDTRSGDPSYTQTHTHTHTYDESLCVCVWVWVSMCASSGIWAKLLVVFVCVFDDAALLAALIHAQIGKKLTNNGQTLCLYKIVSHYLVKQLIVFSSLQRLSSLLSYFLLLQLAFCLRS